MSWWKTAKVGDRIVCLTDEIDLFRLPGPHQYGGSLDGLRLGSIYTVKSIGPSADSDHRAAGHIQVVVDEINRGTWQGREMGFDVRRFRPVQPKSTDTGMAILKSILADPKVRIEEDA